MTEYLIGTGGWAYFQVPGLPSLAAYSRAFNFVEVNSTFYEIPPLKQVEKWRRMVPQDFQFTVRAHQTITHKNRLQSTQETLENFQKIQKTCETLEGDIIHFQMPPSFKMEQTSIQSLRNFLSSVNLGKMRIALEIRGTSPSQLPQELVKTMQENNLIHCVDLSKGEMPAYDSDILYSRLFGKGQHNVYQPTDEELKGIYKKVSKGNFKKVILSFHFTKMFKDAARLKIYKQTGKFSKITKSTGLSSLEEVLKEDAQFPATRQELVRSQGWKLFDRTPDKRTLTRELLQELPEKTYHDLDEVMQKLEPVVG